MGRHRFIIGLFKLVNGGLIILAVHFFLKLDELEASETTFAAYFHNLDTLNWLVPLLLAVMGIYNGLIFFKQRRYAILSVVMVCIWTLAVFSNSAAVQYLMIFSLFLTSGVTLIMMIFRYRKITDLHQFPYPRK